MKQKLNGGFYMLNSKKDLEALKNGDIFKSKYINSDWLDFIIRDLKMRKTTELKEKLAFKKNYL